MLTPNFPNIPTPRNFVKETADRARIQEFLEACHKGDKETLAKSFALYDLPDKIYKEGLEIVCASGPASMLDIFFTQLSNAYQKAILLNLGIFLDGFKIACNHNQIEVIERLDYYYHTAREENCNQEHIVNFFPFNLDNFQHNDLVNYIWPRLENPLEFFIKMCKNFAASSQHLHAFPLTEGLQKVIEKLVNNPQYTTPPQENYQNGKKYLLNLCLYGALKMGNMSMAKFLLTSPSLSEHANIQVHLKLESDSYLPTNLIARLSSNATAYREISSYITTLDANFLAVCQSGNVEALRYVCESTQLSEHVHPHIIGLHIVLASSVPTVIKKEMLDCILTQGANKPYDLAQCPAPLVQNIALFAAGSQEEELGIIVLQALLRRLEIKNHLKANFSHNALLKEAYRKKNKTTLSYLLQETTPALPNKSRSLLNFLSLIPMVSWGRHAFNYLNPLSFERFLQGQKNSNPDMSLYIETYRTVQKEKMYLEKSLASPSSIIEAAPLENGASKTPSKSKIQKI